MTIVDDLTPKYYYVTRIAFQRDKNGNLSVESDIEIKNASGQTLAIDHPHPTLTAQERTAFLNWYNQKTSDYQTATGLQEWIPPV